MKSNVVESTMRDYMAVIFRRKMVIIVTFITVMISVAIGLELKTPMYEAQVKMLVSGKKQTVSPYYRDIQFYGQSLVSVTQSEVVRSNPVIERAVRVLGLHERPFDYEKNFCSPMKAWLIKLINKMQKRCDIPPEQEEEYIFRTAVENLKKYIKVETIRDTDLFTISARDFSPEGAAMIANAVSRSYVIFDLEQQVVELETLYGEKYKDVLVLKDTIATLEKQLSGLPLPTIEAIGPASVKIIEQAQAPFEPAGIRKSLTLVLAFFMSIFLGIMLAFGSEYIDPTFKYPQEVETFLELPLLGTIPKNGFKNKSLSRDAKQALVSHPAYEDLSDQVYLVMKDKKLKALLITAVSPLEGSTAITANLGLSLAREGHKVLVIDANLQSPKIHEIFNIPNDSGLTHVLEEKIAWEEAVKEADCNLSVLTAGSTSMNPTLLFDSTRMANIIKAAREKYRFIFVDYANLRNSHDATILSSYLDGTVVVVNEGKTRRIVIKALIAPLEQKKANILGVIFNNRTFVIPKILYKWV